MKYKILTALLMIIILGPLVLKDKLLIRQSIEELKGCTIGMKVFRNMLYIDNKWK